MQLEAAMRAGRYKHGGRESEHKLDSLGHAALQARRSPRHSFACPQQAVRMSCKALAITALLCIAFGAAVAGEVDLAGLVPSLRCSLLLQGRALDSQASRHRHAMLTQKRCISAPDSQGFASLADRKQEASGAFVDAAGVAGEASKLQQALVTCC